MPLKDETKPYMYSLNGGYIQNEKNYVKNSSFKEAHVAFVPRHR